MKIKPLPRLILIILFVGGLGYGASQYIAKSASTPPEQAGTPTAQNAPIVEVRREAVAPEASVTAPMPPAEPSASVHQGVAEQPNAGLSKLLNSGVKK